jgi:hypothetical protein
MLSRKLPINIPIELTAAEKRTINKTCKTYFLHWDTLANNKPNQTQKPLQKNQP